MAGPRKSPNVKLIKPQNVLFKPVTFDYKELFKSIAKGIGHTASGKWIELGADTVDLLAAIGIQTDPGELGCLLVKRSLISALFDLVADSSQQLTSPSLEDENLIHTQLSESIDDPGLEISQRFLDRPGDLKIVKQAEKMLEIWLSGHTADSHVALSIASRFTSYFVYALNREWRKNAKAYTPLQTAFDTPFMKAGIREWEWASYSAMLSKKVQEPIFDEPFSLKQIYVSPNAFYLEKSKELLATTEVKNPLEQARRFVVSIENQLEYWLEQSDPEDAIRVISGGPGSGKSSFLRVFAAKLAERGRVKVLLLQLHLIDPHKDLVEEVGRFLRDEGSFAENPLSSESPEPNLLIIFDGLDELASQGKIAAETSRSFIHEVERTVQKRNVQELKLRVVISGRELAVQSNQSDFRREGQVLNLLPYYVAESQGSTRSHRDGNEYVDPKGLLIVDLRDTWWANYGKLTGRPYRSLPAALKRSDLEEITTQPLLNYLVALSYTRGKIDFRSDVNLNAIYADLLAAVYQRGYEENRPYEPIRPLSANDFIRILEEIGLAAWHGDGRSTSVSEIEAHCQSSGIGPLLDVFKEGAKAGVTRLLAAFFFRQHGQRSGGDATFVFTHKSFGEYLAARRIARAVAKTVRQRTERGKTPDEGLGREGSPETMGPNCGSHCYLRVHQHVSAWRVGCHAEC
jgi:hypothetical protein